MARMSRRLLVLQGHPDAQARHFGHGLADAYAQGAHEAGHLTRTVDVAALDFPLLRSQADWDHGPLPASLQPVQDAIAWAEHVVVFFPLWMGGMPAVLKGLFEQVLRPGFAVTHAGGQAASNRLLRGRSARIVVTMGMPAMVYRWYFRAHSLKALERNMLGMVGISPIHETLVGSVDAIDEATRAAWLRKLSALGRQGA